jgi:hypothetical protein
MTRIYLFFLFVALASKVHAKPQWLVDCQPYSKETVQRAQSELTASGVQVLASQAGVDRISAPVCGAPSREISGYLVKGNPVPSVGKFINLGTVDFGIEFKRKTTH